MIRKYIDSAIERVFGGGPEPADGMFGDYIPDPPKKPVLFGLDPPKGHYFNVSYSSRPPGAWFVEIRKTGSDMYVCRSLELTSGYSGENSDARCIRTAAGKALREYDGLKHREDLQGNYPPKRTA